MCRSVCGLILIDYNSIIVRHQDKQCLFYVILLFLHFFFLLKVKLFFLVVVEISSIVATVVWLFRAGRFEIQLP